MGDRPKSVRESKAHRYTKPSLKSKKFVVLVVGLIVVLVYVLGSLPEEIYRPLPQDAQLLIQEHPAMGQSPRLIEFYRDNPNFQWTEQSSCHAPSVIGYGVITLLSVPRDQYLYAYIKGYCTPTETLTQVIQADHLLSFSEILASGGTNVFGGNSTAR